MGENKEGEMEVSLLCLSSPLAESVRAEQLKAALK